MFGLRRAHHTHNSQFSHMQSDIFIYFLFLRRAFKNIVASPKKERKPKTSVIVVSITPDASAGSIFILFNVIGMTVPTNPAIKRLIIIAKAMVIPNKLSLNQ